MPSPARLFNILGALACLSAGAGVQDIHAQDLSAQYLPLMGGTGGTAFSRSCPAGSVLTGIRARLGAAIDALGIKCRAVQANGSLGGENDVGSMAGGSGGTGTSVSCPQGSVVARQHVTGVVVVVGYLMLSCYQWIAATRRFGSRTGDLHVITPAGYPLGISVASCAQAVQPARAIRGRAGSLIDAFGLVCNEP